MPQINSLLIANRGEIACRVIKTAKSLGMRTVAVYSDADVNAAHVRLADDAVHIGAPPARESYLDADRIIEAAQSSGADAIHPGYGFLSENAEFAEAVEKAGIIFVGPSAKAIRVMGDKARAKRAMIEAGVPCVPGYQDENQGDEAFIEASHSIGFPVMVKAAAGGGGKGMRLVSNPEELPTALELARAEAKNSFGSEELILEKAVTDARHVEIQVFGDTYGNIIHLGERDCSVQRRHQKIIEEAPCPVMTVELRKAMGLAAVEAARAVNYVGAGTVEFLLAGDGEFYFLEMNTRLQVEHPVTEMITGLDLVALQLRVAEGHALSMTQEDVVLKGHAIEVRLYAEDPDSDFLPSAGGVALFKTPLGEGIRVDSGIETGGTISPFYDPMVAKIITYGQNRSDAQRKMIQALKDTALIGIKSNRDFLVDVLGHQTFADGCATTTFISDNFGAGSQSQHTISNREYAIAATLLHASRRAAAVDLSGGVNPELMNWASNGFLQSTYFFSGENDHPILVAIRTTGFSALSCSVEGEKFGVEISLLAENAAQLRIDGVGERIAFVKSASNELHISTGGIAYVVNELTGGGEGDDAQSGSGVIKAPMHGKIVSIDVSNGDAVSVGDKVAVLEAMKMQHEITAEVDGTVEEIAAAVGTNIAANDVILVISSEIAAK